MDKLKEIEDLIKRLEFYLNEIKLLNKIIDSKLDSAEEYNNNVLNYIKGDQGDN